MEKEEQNDGELSPAVPLEVSAELVAQIDDQLRDFAEDAELETALVVDQSGAVVSGISAEEEVTIEVISALVAGACGAMRALVSELGETSGIESFHQGENRVVYLSEIVHRFVLVGVCGAGTPVGVIRETANQIKPALVDLLIDLEVPELPPEPAPPKRSFRRITASAATVAAIRETPFAEEEEIIESDTTESATGHEPETPSEDSEVPEAGEEISELKAEDLEENNAEEAMDVSEEAQEPAQNVELKPDEPSADEVGTEEAVAEELDEPEPEPVIEILDFGGPEIVIESSETGSTEEVVDSIFEMADEAESESGEVDVPQPDIPEPVDSIFELESDPAESMSSVGNSSEIFEVDEDDSSVAESTTVEVDSLDSSPVPPELSNIPGAIESVPGTVPENIFELEEDPAGEEEYKPLEEVSQPVKDSASLDIFEVDEEEPEANEHSYHSPEDSSGEEDQEGGISRPQYF